MVGTTGPAAVRIIGGTVPATSMENKGSMPP
jgi:hypothetical protein